MNDDFRQEYLCQLIPPDPVYDRALVGWLRYHARLDAIEGSDPMVRAPWPIIRQVRAEHLDQIHGQTPDGIWLRARNEALRIVEREGWEKAWELAAELEDRIWKYPTSTKEGDD